MEEVMYEDDNITLTYFSTGPEYYLEVKSTLRKEIVTMTFDERTFDDFSRRDLEGLSKGLQILDETTYEQLSRTDVLRIHESLLKARKKYEEGFEEFRIRENL